jgi:hypothetical protein
VPCEQVFSSSAETNTKKRNRLHPSLFEALQVLKFAYKKERLDFVSGWKTREPEESSASSNVKHNTLSSLTQHDREHAFDLLLREIHVYEDNSDLV